MKTIRRLALAVLASSTLVSCYDRPVGVLSIPIYESDLKKMKAEKAAEQK